MHLIQLLLPVMRDGSQDVSLREVRARLTSRFGGVTAYSRAPAQGVWVDDANGVVRDDVIIVEVMADDVDRAWWKEFRAYLEARLDQELVVVRATRIEML